MAWDMQRRDGRTEYDCEEIITIKGILLSEDKKNFVVKTEEGNRLIYKGSFKLDELPSYECYWVLAKTGNELKLVDYLG